MKFLYLLITISLLISTNNFAQSSEVPSKDLQSAVQFLDHLATENSNELESLDAIRDRLSKQIILHDLLISKILDGTTATRATCIAECGGGVTAACTGHICTQQDNVGCQSFTFVSGSNLPIFRQKMCNQQ